MNTYLKFFYERLLLGRFAWNTEVFDIRTQDIIFGLPGLEKHGIRVNIQARCLKHNHFGLVIYCFIRWILHVTVLDLKVKPLEAGRIVLIIDTSE